MAKYTLKFEMVQTAIELLLGAMECPIEDAETVGLALEAALMPALEAQGVDVSCPEGCGCGNEPSQLASAN